MILSENSFDTNIRTEWAHARLLIQSRRLLIQSRLLLIQSLLLHHGNQTMHQV